MLGLLFNRSQLQFLRHSLSVSLQLDHQFSQTGWPVVPQEPPPLWIAGIYSMVTFCVASRDPNVPMHSRYFTILAISPAPFRHLSTRCLFIMSSLFGISQSDFECLLSTELRVFIIVVYIVPKDAFLHSPQNAWDLNPGKFCRLGENFITELYPKTTDGCFHKKPLGLVFTTAG